MTKGRMVDAVGLGAPVHTVFVNRRDRVRADVRLPDDVVAEYGGGFIGLLRPRLYERMLDALPPEIEDPAVAGVNST